MNELENEGLFEEKVTLKDRIERQAKLFGQSLKGTAIGVKDWIKDHPYETIGLITATTALGKMCGKTIGNKREEYRRKVEKYDPQTGSWVKIRRPLTAREQVEMAERRKNGESITIILDDFGLLKR